VLLQTARFDASNQDSFLFLHPIKTVAATTLDDLPGLFAQIEESQSKGLYVAGFLSYECGYHFEHFDGEIELNRNIPLAWFGIYEKPFFFDHATGCFDGIPPEKLGPTVELSTLERIAIDVSLDISEADYCTRIRRIKDLIASGDTYQVNFTDRVSLPIPVAPDTAFGILSRQQPVSYGALINNGEHCILSLSPELFFKTAGGRIVTRPMKGTTPRGLDAQEDAVAALRLQRDEKNRSEHIMIVDLLRNDLGRVCTMGSVTVEDLFSVERYETLLQMTSTVSGELRQGLTYYDLFKNLFPSGSITGAPKIRTMEIIRELEDRPRGIYTGAIGFIAPDGSSTFNVAIRTLVLKDGVAEMGVGGGIVADSEPSDEYRECLLKAAFLTRPNYEFELIETLLWDEGFYLLPMHLDRLESSASYFSFVLDRTVVTAKLDEAAEKFEVGGRYRVRLTVGASGDVAASSSQLPAVQQFGRVRLSVERTSSRDVFLRHKTTRRDLYEREFAKATTEGFDEVIFTNERDEVTEGAISNIFVRVGDKMLTPPLSCGVLPGVYRRYLLETLGNVEERVLTVRDLRDADAVLLCNSVRGMHEVQHLDLMHAVSEVI
jgi:para-aminobenzoate synthetase / 4-amino-4-deoxychorismate lyase